MNFIANWKHKHDDTVSKAIDRVLKQIFKDEGRYLIYKYLEAHHSLKRDEITEKIDVFARGLEDLLSSGAYVVEAKILEEIYSSYGLVQRPELNDFPGQIRILMRPPRI
jgi:hypothetical protein